jgi:hypothetical protein
MDCGSRQKLAYSGPTAIFNHQQQLELKLVDDQDGERYCEADEGAQRSDYGLAMEIADRD